MSDARQSVRDDQHGGLAPRGVESLDESRFRAAVERGGGLVEDEKPGFVVERARDPDPLPPAASKTAVRSTSATSNAQRPRVPGGKRATKRLSVTSTAPPRASAGRPRVGCPNAAREKCAATCARPALPRRAASAPSPRRRASAVANASGCGGQRRPVSPSRTVSIGPPEFTATTGRPAAMASTGT